MSSMSKKEAIEKMGCIKKKCSFLDIEGPYSFCKALRTENFCKNKERKNEIDRKTIE